MDKLDRMASDIITKEALKLIMEAYEVVFKGKEKPNLEEKMEVGNPIGKMECLSVEWEQKIRRRLQ